MVEDDGVDFGSSSTQVHIQHQFVVFHVDGGLVVNQDHIIAVGEFKQFIERHHLPTSLLEDIKSLPELIILDQNVESPFTSLTVLSLIIVFVCMNLNETEDEIVGARQTKWYFVRKVVIRAHRC